MAILTPSQLISASNATYFDNTSGSITPTSVRSLNDSWVSSSILVSQTSSLSVLSASYALTASYAENAGTSIDTGSFATTGSNTFTGNQLITGSEGFIKLNGSTAGSNDNTFLSIHANNDGPWIGRYFNDTFSTSSSVLSFWGDNDGTFHFHNESTASIKFGVNNYGDNFILNDTNITANRALIVSSSIYTNGNITWSDTAFNSTTNESGSLYFSSLNGGTLQLNTDGGEGDVLVGYTGWGNKLKVRGDSDFSGSINVLNDIIGNTTLTLKPDPNDARYLQIYNTSPTDTHITASGGYLFVGDDTTYVKVDNYGTEKVIVIKADNGLYLTGSVNVQDGITGSLFGTASYALTASYIDNAAYLTTGSLGQTQVISGSFLDTNTFITTPTLNLGGLLQLTDITDQSGSVINASIILGGTGSLGGSIGFPGVTINTDISGTINSYGGVFSGFLSQDPNYGPGIGTTGFAISSYNGQSGQPEACYYGFGTGSSTGFADNVVFKTTLDSNNLFIYRDVEITGSLNVYESITGTLFGTASHAVSSSYVLNSLSSSYALSASNASFAQTASFTLTTLNAFTASYLNTPLNQSLGITGSLDVGNRLQVQYIQFSGSRFADSVSQSVNEEMLNAYQFGFNQIAIGDGSTGAQFILNTNKDSASPLTEIIFNTRYTGSNDVSFNVRNYGPNTASQANLNVDETNVLGSLNVAGSSLFVSESVKLYGDANTPLLDIGKLDGTSAYPGMRLVVDTTQNPGNIYSFFAIDNLAEPTQSQNFGFSSNTYTGHDNNLTSVIYGPGINNSGTSIDTFVFYWSGSDSTAARSGKLDILKDTRIEGSLYVSGTVSSDVGFATPNANPGISFFGTASCAVSSSYASIANLVNPLIQAVTISGSLDVTGDLLLASGSNKTTGIVTLNGGNPGTVTVSNSLVASTSMIFLTKQTNNHTNAGPVVVSSKGSGTFTITSNHNGDADLVAYMIVNPG